MRQELASGVTFFVYQRDGVMLGVMGVQDVDDVTLIRHSYVCTAERRAGIGSELIRFHKARASRPVLVGCLKAMPWAINFYQRHGFVLVSDTVRDELRRRYWNLSAEHVRNSVVLVDEAWLMQNKRAE